MKSNKSLLLVIASFVLVLLGLVVIFILKTKPFQKKVTSALVSPDQNIEKFCIADNCLEKIDNIWLINQTIPADHTQVENFISKLAKTNLDTVISNNPQNFVSLGISNDLAIPFTIGDNTYQLASSLLNLSQNLIKPKDQDIVYKINFLGDPTDLVSLDFWQVKYLVNISQYQITSLGITSGDITKSYKKDDNNWPKDDILAVVAYLKAGQFIGKSKPDTIIEYQLMVTSEDNSQTVLTFGITKDRLCWATTDNNFYYQIDKSDFDKLTSLIK